MKSKTVMVISYVSIFILLSTLLVLEFTQPTSISGVPIYRFGPDESCLVQLHDDPELYNFITITSNSMTPTIRDSDTVLSVDIERYGIENITAGDIIVFHRGADLICHRVYEVLDDCFRTKGDANEGPDERVAYFADVQAVVIAIFWGD